MRSRRRVREQLPIVAVDYELRPTKVSDGVDQVREPWTRSRLGDLVGEFVGAPSGELRPSEQLALIGLRHLEHRLVVARTEARSAFGRQGGSKRRRDGTQIELVRRHGATALVESSREIMKAFIVIDEVTKELERAPNEFRKELSGFDGNLEYEHSAIRSSLACMMRDC